MKKLLSIFVPCYNEEGNIPELYRRLCSVMEGMPQYDFEVVFSDNRSTDGSREILRQIAAKDKRVKLIFNLRNFGPGRSGAYGFFKTSGDASICLGCDLQDPPELIPRFVEKWEQGYKVVFGRNPVTEEGKAIAKMRGLYYSLVQKFSAHDEYDHVSGFGLYDREVRERLRDEGNPSPNFRISISEYGYEAAFIDYTKRARTAGHSSYNFARYFSLTVESIATTSREPLFFSMRVGVVLGVAFLLASIVALVFLIVMRSVSALIVFLLLVVCLGVSGLAVLTGLSGIYSSLALDWVKKTPLVVEKELVNFDTESDEVDEN